MRFLNIRLKAFGHSSLNEIGERFSDAGEFCFSCSRLLVNEISKRVHDDLCNLIFFFKFFYEIWLNFFNFLRLGEIF